MRAPVFVLRGGRVIDPHADIDDVVDVLVERGRVTLAPAQVPSSARVYDVAGQWVLPGLLDLQVHFREPGFTHKEDLLTGSRAALAGGVTSVVVMPNTKPVLDTPELVRFQGAEARARGGVNVFVAAAATIGSKGEAVTDHGALKAAGAVAVTDDGLPVLDDGVMAASLRGCAQHDLLFMQHAEDTRVTGHAPMNDSETAQRHGVRGQPSWAEAVIVERDIALAEAAGARYHVLHLSTARSLQAVKAAKARGARVSCEASPHHLLLNDADVAHGGAPDVNYKMNPPLRSEDDRAALVQGLIDGTVDAVATDHAPHHHDEKGQGFDRAPFGVTGLETALAATLSFVWNGTLSARRAVELLTSSPARVIGRAGHTGTLWGANAPADVCVVDPARVWEVTPGSILSRSKNSCFLGRFFKGRVTMTFLDGALAYQLIP